MLREFTIDEEYITDVHVREEISLLKDPKNPTNEDLIKIMKGRDKVVTISTKDHDEFTKLRDMLEELGYVRTQRGWWNGDTVIKGFKLNGIVFRKGSKFLCASALKNSLTCMRKFGYKSLI